MTNQVNEVDVDASAPQSVQDIARQINVAIIRFRSDIADILASIEALDARVTALEP